MKGFKHSVCVYEQAIHIFLHIHVVRSENAHPRQDKLAMRRFISHFLRSYAA